MSFLVVERSISLQITIYLSYDNLQARVTAYRPVPIPNFFEKEYKR